MSSDRLHDEDMWLSNREEQKEVLNNLTECCFLSLGVAGKTLEELEPLSKGYGAEYEGGR
jgi:hypothetical protein